MKLEVGKTYITNKGWLVYIFSANDRGKCLSGPLRGQEFTWRSNGRIWGPPTLEYEYQIIAEDDGIEC